MSTRYHLGTCSWSFDEWRGPFYPEHLARAEWLAWYAGIFNAVEADSTFYRVPGAGALAHWAAATGPDFRFCIKAPRGLTHEHPMGGPPGALESFLDALAPLAGRVGCLLFQFPPWLKASAHFAELPRLLERLPAGFRYAVEFRDRSWDAPRFERLLSARAVARVWNDAGPVGECGACLHRPRTAAHAYIRLLGNPATKYDAQGRPMHTYCGLQWDRGIEIEAWVRRLREERGLEEVFVMANNHFEGFAPATVRRFAQALGIPVPQPPRTSPAQGELWDNP